MKIEYRYVKAYKDRHGKLRTYYRRNGLEQRIDGDPLSEEWHERYRRINASFETPERKRRDHNTLAFAIEEYLKSARYEALALNTQKNYRSVIDEMERKFGKHRLQDFSRGAIVKLRDTISKRSKARADLTVKVLRLVLNTAADLDLIAINPAKGITAPPGFKSTPHRKWTDEEIVLFKENAKPHVRRAMMVLLHTGLRCSDALKLKRDAIKQGKICLTTQKTDQPVVIPVHPDLADEMAKPLLVESISMISGARGQELKRHGLLAMFHREFARLGVTDRPVTHGLRKNAVVSMIEVGAGEDIIHSITGQSYPTIRKYGEEFDRNKMAMKVVPLWKKGQ